MSGVAGVEESRESRSKTESVERAACYRIRNVGGMGFGGGRLFRRTSERSGPNRRWGTAATSVLNAPVRWFSEMSVGGPGRWHAESGRGTSVRGEAVPPARAQGRFLEIRVKSKSHVGARKRLHCVKRRPEEVESMASGGSHGQRRPPACRQAPPLGRRRLTTKHAATTPNVQGEGMWMMTGRSGWM